MHRQKTVKSAAQRLAVHQHLQIANKCPYFLLMPGSPLPPPARACAAEQLPCWASTGTRTPVPAASHTAACGAACSTMRTPDLRAFRRSSRRKRQLHSVGIIRAAVYKVDIQSPVPYKAVRLQIRRAAHQRKRRARCAQHVVKHSLAHAVQQHGRDGYRAFKIPEGIDEYAAVHHHLAVGGTAAEGIVQRSIFVHLCALRIGHIQRVAARDDGRGPCVLRPQ